ncbi:MAG: MoaD/ThiS family protein [Myxococcales bacterium]
MATVRFTRHLNRYFPALPEELRLDAASVAALLRQLDERYPGIAHYVADERGALRQHVNVFVDEQPITDRERLSDPLGPASRVFILQALSGG